MLLQPLPGCVQIALVELTLPVRAPVVFLQKLPGQAHHTARVAVGQGGQCAVHIVQARLADGIQAFNASITGKEQSAPDNFHQVILVPVDAGHHEIAAAEIEMLQEMNNSHLPIQLGIPPDMAAVLENPWTWFILLNVMVAASAYSLGAAVQRKGPQDEAKMPRPVMHQEEPAVMVKMTRKEAQDFAQYRRKRQQK